MACSSMLSTIPSLFTAVFCSERPASNCLASRMWKICNKAESPKTHFSWASPPSFCWPKTAGFGTTMCFFWRKKPNGLGESKKQWCASSLQYWNCRSHLKYVCVRSVYPACLLNKEVTPSKTIYHTQRNIEASKVESFSPWRWQPGDAPPSTLLQISLSSTSKDSLANNSDWARNHKVFKSWSLWPYLKYFTYISVWGKGCTKAPFQKRTDTDCAKVRGSCCTKTGNFFTVVGAKFRNSKVWRCLGWFVAGGSIASNPSR